MALASLIPERLSVFFSTGASMLPERRLWWPTRPAQDLKSWPYSASLTSWLPVMLVRPFQILSCLLTWKDSWEASVRSCMKSGCTSQVLINSQCYKLVSPPYTQGLQPQSQSTLDKSSSEKVLYLYWTWTEFSLVIIPLTIKHNSYLHSVYIVLGNQEMI